MSTDRKYKIYMYRFPNGKIYIGMTSLSIQGRRDCGYQHNQNLKNAIHKYGWKNVVTIVLKDGLVRKEAEKQEIYFIDLYQATNPNIGYNISLGGRNTFGGLRHTDEYKVHMSKVMKEKTFTDEHIKNIRLSHEKYSHPVFSIDPNTSDITQYKSLNETARALGGHPSNVMRSCGKNKPYKGLYWRKGVANGAITTVR